MKVPQLLHLPNGRPIDGMLLGTNESLEESTQVIEQTLFSGIISVFWQAN